MSPGTLTMRFYILRNQEVVLASSAKEFGEWVETADRVVSRTQVADVEVSTVFLGIDHQFFAGPLFFLKRWCLVAILIKRAAAVPRGMKR